MDTLIVLFIIVIIIGAFLGGDSFGGTIRKGCGCLIILALGIMIGISLIIETESDNASEDQDSISNAVNSAYFIVQENCQVYVKPDIESDEAGNLAIGNELFVYDINKFNYFYEFTDANGLKAFIRKECLKRK